MLFQCLFKTHVLLQFATRFDGLSIKHSTRKRAIEILTLRNQEAILQEKRQKGLSHGVQNFGYDLILTGICSNNNNNNTSNNNFSTIYRVLVYKLIVFTVKYLKDIS